MFDTYNSYKSGETTFVDRNITINRAPTDESIRLYDEMKQKAYDSILDSFKIESNTINGNVIYYKDIFSYAYIIKYKYKLNGKTHEGKLQFNEFMSKEKVLEETFKGISNQVALNILQDFNIREFLDGI